MICKKCWADAYMRMISNPMLSQTDHYRALLDERYENPCSEEEQFGIEEGGKDG